MPIKIEKVYLQWKEQNINALAFIPGTEQEVASAFAIFTHGYTSHKGSLLNWPVRLCEEGIPSLIFDLPGHYLGGFSEVDDFDYFKTHSPKLFLQAFEQLKKLFLQSFPLNDYFLEEDSFKLVIGGHSLGALLSLKALKENLFPMKASALCVGLGTPAQGDTHLFQTPFYKSTLQVRSQLVSPALNPDNLLSWIFDEKSTIDLQDETIHFITGVDDLVVGKGGTQRMIDHLENRENKISFDEVKRLPHHTPEMAASYIKKYFKRILQSP